MIVSIDSLEFGYSSDKPIFKGFNWEIAAGERWAILGPSGCGKSTLLLIMAGILKPNSGDVSVGGRAIQRPRPSTGLILQNYGLLPWATVQQNAELGIKVRDFYGPDGTHAPEKIDEVSENSSPDYWLKRLGLEEFRDRYPSQISGGQQQRTAIARSLSLSPDLLLMDEPFGSLDAPTSQSLQNLSIELNREDQIAMVMVTHSVETAAFLGEKILVLGNPPNSSPKIIENLKSGDVDYRSSKDYLDICQLLSNVLDNSA